MHTPNEFICIDDVVRAIEAGKNLVKDLGLKKYEFTHEQSKPLYTGSFFFSDEDEEDETPFNDDIHSLSSIDVIEEKNGIIISDIYDENQLYIDDEDGFRLYEILRNRYL
jgi:hypothetical protein